MTVCMVGPQKMIEPIQRCPCCGPLSSNMGLSNHWAQGCDPRRVNAEIPGIADHPLSRVRAVIKYRGVGARAPNGTPARPPGCRGCWPPACSGRHLELQPRRSFHHRGIRVDHPYLHPGGRHLVDPADHTIQRLGLFAQPDGFVGQADNSWTVRRWWRLKTIGGLQIRVNLGNLHRLVCGVGCCALRFIHGLAPILGGGRRKLSNMLWTRWGQRIFESVELPVQGRILTFEKSKVYSNPVATATSSHRLGA